MDSKFSRSWINMRIHYDNMARSGILTEFIEKNDLNKNYHMIDMCTGSGSFLIWALKQGLFPDKAILVDNDINLLKSIKSNLRQNFKNIYVIKSNNNNLDLSISDKSQQKSNVSIVKENCDTYEIKDAQPHIISYSAAIDLMSKSSIDICLKKIKHENILFLSLCFDGKVKWKPSHPYDKYIMSYFNKHQSYDKGFGKALGYKSIDYVNKKAKELGYKIKIADSPWIIQNESLDDIIFLKRYVSDIKKSLFHMDGIDRSMLRRWHNDKIDSITNKSIKVQVGHKDLLLYKK